VNYLIKAMPVMEAQTNRLEKIMNVREKRDKRVKELFGDLMDFEDKCLDYFTENDSTKRKLTNDYVKEKIDNKLDEVTSQLENPFYKFFLWFKGEYLETRGVYDCLCGVQQVMKLQQAREAQIKD